MSDRPLLRTLADWAIGVRAAGAPPDVADSVRQRVLDIFGLQAAALDLDTSAAALAFVDRQQATGPATAFGLGRPTSAVWAAFCNGVLAHSLDYDDTHLPSILHPSASVVPAAVAAGEGADAGGRDCVAAIAAGLEIAVRIGMAGYDRRSRNSLFFEHGQHATSICGAVGAAAAAALAMGLDADGVADAMAVSLSMASGILEANRTGGTVKRLHCGWAAHSAVAAAELVEHGFSGPPTGLEGRFGFFQAWLHGSFFSEELTDGLGESWAVPAIHFKPYPANHFTHCAVDAAANLRRDGLKPDDVRRIVLRVPTPVVRTIGEPIEAKRRPQTSYQAQFSGPYTVVASLVGGGGLGLAMEDFAPALLREPQRLALMDLVEVRGDEECDAVYPFELPAILEVTTAGGQVLVEKVMANRGGPRRPLTAEELSAKYRGNAARAWPAELVRDVESRLAGLEEQESLRPLMSQIAAVGAGHHGPAS